MSFADKYGPWAVIAGASEGTGREFARQIAAEGLNLVLIARREGPLAEIADEIRREHGVECVTASVDLARPDAAEQVAKAADGREVGLYVNNAGADPNGSRFLDKELQAWVDLAQRNVMTTLQTCHHFAGPMRARGKGGLLLVNSGACYGGASFLTTYSASKAFDLVFAEGLWAELNGHGVDVLTLVMGQTDTPAYRALLAEKEQPLPENWASPADVARTGLEQLPHGPIFNWGQTNDVAGYAPNSPDARRARVQMISQHTTSSFGGPAA
jgi:short-subunit dehydrogenase